MLRAREQGYGWDHIGAYLGISRQAVAQRFGRLLDQLPERSTEQLDVEVEDTTYR